jgi:hypothetical protein
MSIVALDVMEAFLVISCILFYACFHNLRSGCGSLPSTSVTSCLCVFGAS